MTATTLHIKSTLRERFFLIANEFARDATITPRACKVYLYLMSHSDGWKISVNNLSKAVDMSKTTTGHALDDLEKAGYIYREQRRNNGRFSGWDYLVFDQRHDTPKSENASP